MLLMSTAGAPTTHGDVVSGTHGIGARVPSAAARPRRQDDDELHIPKGGTFMIGT